VAEGLVCGTTGQNKQLEAIQVVFRSNVLGQTTLTRWYDGPTDEPDHVTRNTGEGAPWPYHAETSFGRALVLCVQTSCEQTAQPGTRPLYECFREGFDSYTSIASNCEIADGSVTPSGILGWVYSSQPTGIPIAPLYRCTTDSVDHFDSLDPSCEGRKLEYLLGYVITS
jgi:hypothetical protein